MLYGTCLLYVCSHVYVPAHTCVCTYVCTHVYAHVYTHVYNHADTVVSKYACVHLYTHCLDQPALSILSMLRVSRCVYGSYQTRIMQIPVPKLLGTHRDGQI